MRNFTDDEILSNMNLKLMKSDDGYLNTMSFLLGAELALIKLERQREKTGKAEADFMRRNARRIAEEMMSGISDEELEYTDRPEAKKEFMSDDREKLR